MANTRFIQAAIKRPGALTAKAKAAGMTVREFALAHQHDAGVTGDQARFYLNVLARVGSTDKTGNTDKTGKAGKAGK